jgi:hypothetical protein
MLRTCFLALAAIATLATSVLMPAPASASFSFGRSVHGGASHEFQCCRKHPT